MSIVTVNFLDKKDLSLSIHADIDEKTQELLGISFFYHRGNEQKHLNKKIVNLFHPVIEQDVKGNYWNLHMNPFDEPIILRRKEKEIKAFYRLQDKDYGIVSKVDVKVTKLESEYIMKFIITIKWKGNFFEKEIDVPSSFTNHLVQIITS